MQQTGSTCVSHRPMPHRASVWLFPEAGRCWDGQLLGNPVAIAPEAVTSSPSGGAVNVSFAGVAW